MAKPIRFDTEHLWWIVKLEPQGRHTTATVTGHSHAIPRLGGSEIRPGRHESFTDADTDREALLARIRARIEQLDGPIGSTTDSDAD